MRPSSACSPARPPSGTGAPILLWRHAQPFHKQDEYFGKDIGFYVFSLPWWHYVVDFVMAAAVVAVIATAVVHYLYGGIRLQVPHDRLSGAAQVQFSVLLGVFVLAKGVDYYLDRFDLVTNDNHLFTGMNYTGENALLPARNILMGVALICAVLFFLNIWRRTWQLPSVGLALLVLSAILLGMIWPAIVQNFQVKPTEADKEESYIQNNIDATRDAYGIKDVESEPFTAIPDPTATPEPGACCRASSTRFRWSTRSRSTRRSSRSSSRRSTTRWRRCSTSTATTSTRAGCGDAAGAGGARARPGRDRRPQLVEPPHGLHPRRGHHRRLCEPGRLQPWRQREHELGRGRRARPGRVLRATTTSSRGSTTASRARPTPSSARRPTTPTTSSSVDGPRQRGGGGRDRHATTAPAAWRSAARSGS